MQATISPTSINQDSKSSDVQRSQEKDLERKNSIEQKDRDKVQEKKESEVPFNLEDVPLTAADAEKKKVENEGPPTPKIEEIKEVPEALPVPEPPVNTENSGALVNSLSGLPATSFLAGMGQVSEAAGTVQSKEQTALSDSMPEIDQPTGLPVKGSTELAEYKPKKGISPELKTKKGGKKQDIPVEHKSDLAPIPKQTIPKIEAPKEEEKTEESGSWWSRMTNYVSANINSIKTKDGGVNTNAGSRPKVDTSGEADLTQNDNNRAATDATINQEQAKADLNTTEYRGEEEIYPEIQREKLSPNVELTAIEEREVKPIEELTLTPEVREAIDTEAQVKMEAEVQPEIENNNTEYQSYQDESVVEKEKANTQIDEETIKAKSEQEAEQKNAKSEVSKEREDWKTENESVKKEYANKSDKERTKIDGQIDKKIEDTDNEVESEYDEAETQAAADKLKAETQAVAEKTKAKEKEEDKGFWGRVGDAIGDFFDAIRKTVNKIFDKLREGVKILIEKAKKAVNALIDLARDAIVGFIEAFGTALKGLVSIALSAFPALRDKVLAAIDKAVDKAVNTVNTIAEGLKEIANRLLDALGAALDAVLVAYQAIMNAVLDVLEFITVGLIKITAFLGTLVAGAWNSTSYFRGALAEEALGGNPAEPLPNFEVPNGQEKQWAAAMGLSQEKAIKVGEESAEKSVNQVENLLTKPKISDEDVAIEPNPAVELDRTLLKQVSHLEEGETFEIGGAGENAVTTEQFQEAAADEMGLSLEKDSIDTINLPIKDIKESDSSTKTEGGDAPNWRKMSDQQKLDHYLGDMLKETEDQAGESPTPNQEKPEVDTSLDESTLITKTGRLGVTERLAFMGEQMLTGIQMIWNNYKGWIIGGAVGALLVAGLIAFFTGGAGLIAVVEVVSQALMLIFGAIAIKRASGSFWDYVNASWDGKSEEAAKKLSSAFAIIISEFFLDKILLGMGKVFKRILKGAKKLVKGTKLGAKAFNKINKVRKGLGKVIKGGKGIIKKGVVRFKNNRFVIRIQGKMSKGAKRFNKLRDDILGKFGFKKIWIEKHGKYVEMWGEFNSKILLMKENGDVETKELSSAQKKHFGKDKQIGKTLNDPKLADDIRVDGDNVIVSNSFERRYDKMSPDDKVKAIDNLKNDKFSIRREEGLKGSKPDITIDADFIEDLDKLDDVVKTKKFDQIDKNELDALAEKGKKAGTPKEKRDISEEIGEKATDAHAKKHKLNSEYTGKGPLTFDKVYKKGDTHYVFEAKGGNSSLGGKRVDVGGVEEFAEQGTRDYLERTIKDMLSSKDAAKRKVARNLQDSLDAGKVKYILSQQKLTNTGNIGEFIVKEFSI